MSQRILPMLGALLALAIMAVGPSLAMAHPGPAATAAGGAGANNWNDYNSPYSGWGGDWWDHDHRGNYWNGWGDGNGYFDGSSCDGCSGSSSASSAQATTESGVARVMVAVKRLRRSGCQNVYSTGRLSHRRSCSRTHWMPATGTSAWRFDFPRDLPHGRYELRRRAVDNAGNREAQQKMRLSIR
jgi:hypothetical protein